MKTKLLQKFAWQNEVLQFTNLLHAYNNRWNNARYQSQERFNWENLILSAALNTMKMCLEINKIDEVINIYKSLMLSGYIWHTQQNVIKEKEKVTNEELINNIEQMHRWINEIEEVVLQASERQPHHLQSNNVLKLLIEIENDKVETHRREGWEMLHNTYANTNNKNNENNNDRTQLLVKCQKDVMHKHNDVIKELSAAEIERISVCQKLRLLEQSTSNIERLTLHFALMEMYKITNNKEVFQEIDVETMLILASKILLQMNVLETTFDKESINENDNYDDNVFVTANNKQQYDECHEDYSNTCFHSPYAFNTFAINDTNSNNVISNITTANSISKTINSKEIDTYLACATLREECNLLNWLQQLEQSVVCAYSLQELKCYSSNILNTYIKDWDKLFYKRVYEVLVEPVDVHNILPASRQSKIFAKNLLKHTNAENDNSINNNNRKLQKSEQSFEQANTEVFSIRKRQVNTFSTKKREYSQIEIGLEALLRNEERKRIIVPDYYYLLNYFNELERFSAFREIVITHGVFLSLVHTACNGLNPKRFRARHILQSLMIREKNTIQNGTKRLAQSPKRHGVNTKALTFKHQFRTLSRNALYQSVEPPNIKKRRFESLHSEPEKTNILQQQRNGISILNLTDELSLLKECRERAYLTKLATPCLMEKSSRCKIENEYSNMWCLNSDKHNIPSEQESSWHENIRESTLRRKSNEGTITRQVELLPFQEEKTKLISYANFTAVLLCKQLDRVLLENYNTEETRHSKANSCNNYKKNKCKGIVGNEHVTKECSNYHTELTVEENSSTYWWEKVTHNRTINYALEELSKCEERPISSNQRAEMCSSLLATTSVETRTLAYMIGVPMHPPVYVDN